MDEITKQDLLNLCEQSGELLTSIYLATQKTGDVRARQADKTRFKNMLQELEQQFDAGSVGKPGKSQLKLLRTLYENESFWRGLGRAEGLAVFADHDRMQTLQLPANFEPLNFAGSHYYLKPLMSLPEAGKSFYILAVSFNQVRLFAANAYRIWEVESETLPDNINQALMAGDHERTLQFRTQAPTDAGGEGQAVFHGHGGKKDLGDIEPPLYLQAIATALNKVLPDQDRPLIFAGVEELFALYKQQNQYSTFTEKNLPGNHEHTSLDELHQLGLEALKPYFETELREASSKYRQLAGADPQQAATQPAEVLGPAREGRLEAVFLPKNKERWVKLENDRVVETFGESRWEAVGLFDLIAKNCFRQGGSVFVVDPSDLPDSPMAAIFRY